MRNFKNNRRKFRSSSFDRGLKINTNDQGLHSNLGNISDFKKKNYSRNNFNSSKLIQKYSDLAREALSSGDKILYENYLQHAEHFIRVSDGNTNSVVSKKNLSTEANEKNRANNNKEEEVTKDNQIEVKQS